jgi:hypothetical protein
VTTVSEAKGLDGRYEVRYDQKTQTYVVFVAGCGMAETVLNRQQMASLSKSLADHVRKNQ